METYKLTGYPNQVQRLSDEAYIPFDPANIDYQQFKVQVLEGATLEDAEGVAMTQEEADAFIATLP